MRQLANMSSGIPSYTANTQFQQELFGDPTSGHPRRSSSSCAARLRTSRRTRGWEYSNTNYVLLDTVIEQVTGQPIADVYEERIFGPLGNDADHLPDRDRRHRRPHLYGISNENQPAGKTIVTTDWSPSAAFTAREIISTLDDVTKWGEAPFTGEGILEPAAQQPRRDSIIYGIPPANSPTAGYGIGIGNRDGWWGHDDDIPCYTTVLFHNYDIRTTVVIAVNSDVPTTGTPPRIPRRSGIRRARARQFPAHRTAAGAGDHLLVTEHTSRLTVRAVL